MEYMCNFWNFGKWPSWFSSRPSIEAHGPFVLWYMCVDRRCHCILSWISLVTNVYVQQPILILFALQWGLCATFGDADWLPVIHFNPWIIYSLIQRLFSFRYMCIQSTLLLLLWDVPILCLYNNLFQGDKNSIRSKHLIIVLGTGNMIP